MVTKKKVQNETSTFQVTPKDFHRSGEYCIDSHIIHLDIDGKEFQVSVKDDTEMLPWYVDGLLDFHCVNEFGEEPELREAAKIYCTKQVMENNGGYTWADLGGYLQGFIEGYLNKKRE